MIAALQGASITAAVRDRAGTVATDVVERMHAAVAGPCHHDGLIEHLAGEEIAGLGELAQVPDQLPGSAKDTLALERQHRRIGVPACRNGRRLGKVRVEAECARIHRTPPWQPPHAAGCRPS